MSKELQFLIYNTPQEDIKDFYAMVQNELHFAITGQTAAEIIHTKTDKEQDNMGLQAWRNPPEGRTFKYNTFNKTQKIESDFDKAIKSLKNKGER